ncbi:MAG: GatB/YqeY domain-containing protein [Owenweeksia sp.]|nr:GatB/YqeY domain-containing protein [Owenweeksia sp.]
MLAETEKGKGTTLSQEAELKILQQLQKQRKDALENLTEKQGRDDLAQEEREQLQVIEDFLPQQMNAEEPGRWTSRELITKLDAQGPQDRVK